MKIIRKIEELKNILQLVKDSNKSIGLVLTMGNMHEGHLSLVREAQIINEFVLTTIFINPTQFDSVKDFNSYPKTLDEDIEKLQSINCNLLFLPDINEIYPNGQIIEKSITKYRDILCDKYRPGHFDGVTTVVNNFFNLIKPNNSYFGEKDFQQIKFITELVKIKKHKVKIISCPSVRDKIGMSLASRNSKFTKDQNKIFKNLAKEIMEYINLIKQKNTKMNFKDFKKNLFKINIYKIDYIEIRDESTLEITDDFSNARLFVALYIDEIRIIDNFKLF